uniref:Uncharacterized protein n=1 Tax=Streptomyces sp. NBC_00003 TaxID=2903608 RepID=A0AAU2V830_9ACTN
MTVLARIISDTRRPVYVVVDGLPDEPHTVSLRRFGTPGDDPEVGRLVDRQEGAGSVTLQDPGDPGRGEPPNNPPYGVPITYEVEVDGENENPEMHEAAGSPVTLAESQPWPLPRLALEAKTSATPDDRATTTFTVTNGKQAGTATVATGDGRSIEITLDASGTGTGTYQYSDPGHHTYTATVTAPCPVRYSTWVSLESSIETWAAVGGFVDTWADPGRATETASATVEVDVGPATLWATVTPDQPLPYIQIDAWIGDPGTVTAWQIERVAPQGGGDQNVPIYLDDKSSGAISIEDHEAPLAQPVIYRLTITRKGGAVQVIESSPVVLGGTRGCFLTDTTSGATVAVTLRAWAERSRKARQSVLAVLNRADPVVLSDMHTTPEGKWVFLTRTQAELEALYGVLLSGRLVLLRTQPASAIRTTYAAVGDVSESRLYPELGDAWERLVEVEIQEVAPIPATARALRVGWEQVADHWARWDAVPADMPTWLDLSRWKPVA